MIDHRFSFVYYYLTILFSYISFFFFLDGEVADCLRSVPAATLFSAYIALGCDRYLDQSALRMGPLIDGFHYPDYVANTL
jgi:hypothetical protein